MKPLCIYHGNCDDGFGSAWSVRHALHEVEFYPGIHQQNPPDVVGRDVLIVDFSYRKPILEQMAKEARTILILDHHKTAMEDLLGLPSVNNYESVINKPNSVHAIFDMNRSGAGITWDFFHPNEPRIPFINYIEDVDLWRRSLPGCSEFILALRSYPQEFDVWDDLIESGIDRLISEGSVIQRFFQRRIEEFKNTAYIARLAGIPIWITNAPHFAASDVAGELCNRGLAFGASYFEVSPNNWRYSLRSRDDFDVSEIAKKFGGGGHKNAAGFTSNKIVHTIGD